MTVSEFLTIHPPSALDIFNSQEIEIDGKKFIVFRRSVVIEVIRMPESINDMTEFASLVTKNFKLVSPVLNANLMEIICRHLPIVKDNKCVKAFRNEFDSIRELEATDISLKSMMDFAQKLIIENLNENLPYQNLDSVILFLLKFFRNSVRFHC